MRRPTTILIAVITAMALLFTGCGGDDSDGDAGATSTAPSDDAPSDGDAENGRELYLASCQSCHGPDAEGLEGLGKPLVASEFIGSASDADLVVLVTEGRPASHPDNTTGVDMPPKGGNPSLSEADIADIVAYMRSLN